MSVRASGPVLPSTLSRWAEALAPLDPTLAIALGPLLHTVDELVGRLDAGTGDTGELDGFDGTTLRGDPERLLLSEWALAQEVPLEFLRRAAENELSYLQRSYRTTRSRGRVVVACDVGPDQLGPGRLVQLAALVVLVQRARNAGSEVEVRILQSGASLTGDLAEILPDWLVARSGDRATPDACSAVAADLAAEDRLWLLVAAPAIAPAGHRRVLTSRVSAWTDVGADQLTVRVGDSSARLPMPPARVAIAALRGEGLLARRSATSVAKVPGAARGALFASADTRLLWRGESGDIVHSYRVGPGEGNPSVKTHRVNGTVLAGAFLGRRLVLATTDGTRVRIRTIGKRLASVDAIDALLVDIGLDPTAVEQIGQEPLRPLYLSGGNIVLRGGGDAWWTLAPEGAWDPLFAAIAPGRALDAPRTAYNQGHLYVANRVVQPSAAAAIVFGPVEDGHSWFACSQELRVWQVHRGGTQVAEIAVPEGDRVIGLMLLPRPSLITVSQAGILVRHFTEQDTYTWTRYSGPGQYGVHPIKPWLVRTSADGITVADLSGGGSTVAELRSTS